MPISFEYIFICLWVVCVYMQISIYTFIYKYEFIYKYVPTNIYIIIHTLCDSFQVLMFQKEKKVSSASFEAQPGPFCEVSRVASHLKKKKIQTLGFKFMELECFKRSYS